VASMYRSWVIHSNYFSSVIGSIMYVLCLLKYSSAPVSTGNTFQDLPQVCETADNTDRYI
jgi:hypothetical protein